MVWNHEIAGSYTRRIEVLLMPLNADGDVDVKEPPRFGLAYMALREAQRQYNEEDCYDSESIMDAAVAEIPDLGLREINALEGVEVLSIEDLLQWDVGWLQHKIRNIGPVMADGIRDKCRLFLEAHGVTDLPRYPLFNDYPACVIARDKGE